MLVKHSLFVSHFVKDYLVYTLHFTHSQHYFNGSTTFYHDINNDNT